MIINALLGLVKSFVLLMRDTRKNKLNGDQNDNESYAPQKRAIRKLNNNGSSGLERPQARRFYSSFCLL